jgi:hypothetical protein
VSAPGPGAGAASASAAALARGLAGQARELGAGIEALRRQAGAAGEPARRAASATAEIAASWVRQAAASLDEAAADLARVSAAAAPGTCSIPWGACPEHGGTLSGTGGITWCRVPGCGRSWSWDRMSLPCGEPARWTVTDQHGTAALMCDGHAADARRRLEGARLAPLPGTGGR